MTIIEKGKKSLNELSSIMASSINEIGCHLFIHSHSTRNRKKTWFKIAMEKTVTKKITDATSQAIYDILQDARSDHLAKFDFDSVVNGEVAILEIGDIESLSAWFAELPPDTFEDTFNGDGSIAEEANLFVRRLTFPDKRCLVTVTGKSGLKVHLSEKGKVAAFFSEQQHEMRDIQGAILTLDGRIDFLLWDDLVFVQRMNTFESLTHVREATIKRATEALEKCTKIFDFGKNFDLLKKNIMEQPSLAKRLAAADRYGYMDDMTGLALKNRAKDKQLNIDFIKDDVTGKVSLNIDEKDKKQVKDLVDLLAEFFLKSPVTNREYEAMVKRPARPRRKPTVSKTASVS